MRRDLRRHPLRLGLRPARRRAQGEHQAAVVALDGAAGATTSSASTPRSSCRRQTWEASGHVDDVHRPADRVPVVPQALPRRPPPGGLRREARRRARRSTPTPSTSPASPAPTAAPAALDRAARVQPDAQDLPRRRSRTSRACTTCAPRPRRASSSTSPTCMTSLAPQAAVRHRPDRQVASATRSPRATSSSAPASSSRWRWSSSSSPARTRSGTSTGSTSAPDWYVDLGINPDNLRHYEHPQEKLSPLLQAHRRHRVPLPLRRAPSGASSRASPTAPTSTSRTHSEHSGQDLQLLRPGDRRALHALRHRARGRR